MDRSQSTTPIASNSRAPADEIVTRWPADDDFELGWECANPELQIDAWREGPGKLKHELN